jgi:hypothetical protein
MAILKLPDCEMFYRVDDFTDPWEKPETVLMLHGNAESSLSWYAWTPILARHFQVSSRHARLRPVNADAARI